MTWQSCSNPDRPAQIGHPSCAKIQQIVGNKFKRARKVEKLAICDTNSPRSARETEKLAIRDALAKPAAPQAAIHIVQRKLTSYATKRSPFPLGVLMSQPPEQPGPAQGRVRTSPTCRSR